MPAVIWVVAAGPALNQILSFRQQAHPLRLLPDVNPDIGGLGVRIGLYIPVVLAVMTLFAGCFHKDEAGAKDIGKANLLSMYDLSVKQSVFECEGSN